MSTVFSTRIAEIRLRILLVLVAGVPLLFIRSALDPINVPKLALLMAGLSVAVALRIAGLLQGDSSAGLTRLLIPVTAITAPLVLAWLFSSYKGWSLFGQYPRFTGLIPYLLLALFGVMLADAFQGRASSLAWAFLIAGGIAGAYAIVQFLGLDPLSWTVKGGETDVVASTLGNPNFVGAFLGMVLIVGGGLIVVDPAQRRWSIALTALTAVGWLVARSEAGWAAAVAGGAVAAGIVLSTRWSKAKLIGALGGGLVLVAVVGSVVLAIAQGPDSSLPDTAKRRADWWKGAVAMVADSPIVGRGPSTFALEHSRYRTANDALQVGSDITDDPHSIFLSFLTGAGILGLIGLLTAIAWVMREGRRLEADNVIGAAFFGAFCAYLVQASVSIDTVALRAAMWTAVAGVIVSALPEPASATSRSGKKKARARPAPIKNLPGVAVVFLMGAVALWLSGRFLSADTNARSSVVALSSGDIATGQDRYQAAIDRRDEVAYREAYGDGIGRLAGVLAEAGEKEPALRLADEAKDAFSFVNELPDVGAIIDFARVLRRVSAVDPPVAKESLALYERAIELDPRNASLVGDAAYLALAMEDYGSMVRLVEDHPALDTSPGLQGLLAFAYAHLGREEEARVLAEQALSGDPEQVLAQDALALLRPDD